MRLIFLLMLCFSFNQSIYNIQVTSLNGASLPMSNYKGFKLLIYQFNGANVDTSELKYLDSVQKTNSSIKVLAVPSSDFSVLNLSLLSTILTNLKLSFPILQPSLLKKAAGSNQNTLFKWLTDVNQNTHFNRDVIQPGEMYLISETGNLYSIITAGTSNEIITKIINQPSVN